MGRALYTDLYELNMAASYLRRDMHGDATFSLYVRVLPPTRGFLVAAGLESCLEFAESFRFEKEDLEYLRRTGFDDETLDRFRRLEFEGDVWAVPEGTIVFAGEPILEVTAPIAQAQVLETYLLNQVTLHTTMASKAARFVLAAGGRDLVDFSFRRTAGAEAAMAVARSSALVGFVATSNVEAARRLGLRASGTMAHSYVESFPTEADAFRAFAEDFPDRTTLLVDTYDTLNGVRTAVTVIRELGLQDRAAIRLDSGDLRALSKESRQILDREGLERVRIFASGGLDELEVEKLVGASTPIDAFGIGTQLGASVDAPYVDTVYKLVSYDGRPTLKLSPHKVTPPGAKQVFRGEDLPHDVIALRDEPAPPGSAPLMKRVMAGGRRTGPPASLENARRTFAEDLERLPAGARRLRFPERISVAFSDRARALAEASEQDIRTRIVGPP